MEKNDGDAAMMLASRMIGGSNCAGVPPAAFAMPSGMVMRYDLPAPPLADLITGYAIYGETRREPMLNVFLPAPPMLCVLVDAGPVSVTIRNHRFDRVADVSLYGPSSHAPRVVTRGGINVGIGLSALGWAALTAVPAHQLHNRVVAASEILPPSLVRLLAHRLSHVASDAEMAPVIDDVLGTAFARIEPRVELIAALSALLLRDGMIEAEEVARQAGLSAPALRRLTLAKFGLPPKLLLRRARFLRTFIRIKLLGEAHAAAIVDGSYHDRSHFLRDARSFLGTTPRRLEREGTIFLTASLRARAATLGAATHALHGAAGAG